MSGRAPVDPAVEQVCKLKASLALPDPWDLNTFVAQVAETVGKPISVVAQPELAADGFPCGLVVERTGDIVIIYDSTSSGYHGDHIVLHEIAHLLLNHADPGDDGHQHAGFVNAVEVLLPDCDPAGVLRVLGRTDYDETEESQAELFASLVMSESRYGRPQSSLRATFFRD
jgi:hypothetical protein